MPTSGECHPALCSEVKNDLHSPDWRYSTKVPKTKRICPLCADLIDRSPVSLDDYPLVEFIKSNGWARDYFSAPEPEDVLGSYPARLPPSLLVDVGHNTMACFATMKEEYIPSLSKGDRQPGYFIRSGAGWGKSFNMQEVLAWTIAASSAFEHSCSIATGHVGQQMRLKQEQVIRKLREAGTLGFVRSTTAYCVNFNGATRFQQRELAWGDAADAGMFIHVRVCYTELVDSDKVSWECFLNGLALALEAKRLSLDDVRAAALAVLQFCRGYPGAIPLLHVDEVVKVMRYTKSRRQEQPGATVTMEKPNAADEIEQVAAVAKEHAGAAAMGQAGAADKEQAVAADKVHAVAADKKPQAGASGKEGQPGIADVDQAGPGAKDLPVVKRDVEHADDLVAGVCSEACQSLQDLYGAVLFTTMEHSVMRAETSRSGRAMFPAMELTFLDPMSFGSAVTMELAPLFQDGVASALDMNVLEVGKGGRGLSISPFVLLLCALLGGHPRLVGLFLRNLKSRVKTLVNKHGSRSPVIFASDVQLACWASIEAAMYSAAVDITLASVGGQSGLNLVTSEVFLGGLVELDAVAIKRREKIVTWDELAGDGVVLLKDHRALAVNTWGGLNKARPVLHPMTALKMAFLGGSCVRYAAFQEMLMCPGSRLTGERLEGVIANWCVVMSYARAEHSAKFSSVPLKDVWAFPRATARVGSADVLNHVCVDASIARELGVKEASLATALDFATKHPEEAVKVVFRLNSGAARALQPAVDVVEFFLVKQAFGRFQVNDVIAVVYQVKDCGVGRSGAPSLADVNNAWKLIEGTILEDAEMRNKWLGNIIFVYGNRLPNDYGVRSTSRSRVEFDSGRASGQSVLLGGSDLSGWLPDFVSHFLGVSQFLDQAGLSKSTLEQFGKPR